MTLQLRCMQCRVYMQRIKQLYVIRRRVQSVKAELVNERLPVLEPYLESQRKQPQRYYLPPRHYCLQKAVQNKSANLLFYRSLETTVNAGHIQGRQRPLLQQDGLPQPSIDETSHKNVSKHTSRLFTQHYHLDMESECFKQAPDIIAECSCALNVGL